eukprot:scaffold5562_cov31-Tisochrysis_lutea.AAC.3
MVHSRDVSAPLTPEDTVEGRVTNRVRAHSSQATRHTMTRSKKATRTQRGVASKARLIAFLPSESQDGSSASAATIMRFISEATHGLQGSTMRSSIGSLSVSPITLEPACNSRASTIADNVGGSPPCTSSPATRVWTHEIPPSKSPTVSIHGRTAPSFPSP